MVNSGGKWNVFLQIFISFFFFLSRLNEKSKQNERRTKPNQKPNLQANATKKKYKKTKLEKRRNRNENKGNGNEVTRGEVESDSKPVQRHRVFNSIESGMAVRQLKIHKLPQFWSPVLPRVSADEQRGGCARAERKGDAGHRRKSNYCPTGDKRPLERRARFDFD